MRIGVLGGAGSFAGVEMVRRINEVSVSLGASRDSDFPEIVYLQHPFHHVSLTGKTNQQGLLELYSNLERFLSLNVNAVLFACNSLDLKAKAHCQTIGLPYVSLFDTLGEFLDDSGETYMFYGSQSSQTQLEQCEQLRFPNLTPITYIETGITGHTSEAAFWDYIEQTSEGLTPILGCTELSLFARSNTMHYVDTVDLVVKKALHLLGEER